MSRPPFRAFVGLALAGAMMTTVGACGGQAEAQKTGPTAGPTLSAPTTSSAVSTSTTTSKAPTKSATSALPTLSPTVAASELPPTGSGATVPGLTLTSPPPIVPQGATKTNAACRQIYPIVIGAIKAWNDASVADSRSALQSAALGLSKAAESAPTLAKGSGDARLISLTADVSARLKGVVTSYANEEAVDGGPLTESADALWAYCGSGR